MTTCYKLARMDLQPLNAASADGLSVFRKISLPSTTATALLLDGVANKTFGCSDVCSVSDDSCTW